MIWVILAIGLIIRLVGLNQSLWLDEGINVLAAQRSTLLEMVTQYAQADFHPPAWFMVLWLWGKTFGYSEISVRMPSVIFGLLTIYFVFLIGKKLLSKELGLIAALLLAFNPLHIFYSQEARMYSLAALAVSINIFLIIKIIKGEKVNLIVLILSNLLILLSDYVAYFIFPAELIFLLVLKRKEVIKKWVMGFIAAVILNILWWPVFFKQLDVGAAASSQLPTWKFVVGGFDFKLLPLTFVKFIIGRISLYNKILYALALLPVCSLFAYLLFVGAKRIKGFPRNLLLIWLIIPPLIATIISIFIPVYSYFRVLFVVPAFLLLTAIGILSFKNKTKYIFLIAVVFIELASALIYLLNPIYQREDWRGLVNFFKNTNSPVILFESSGTLPPFDYYAKGSLNAKGALKDFPATNEGSVLDLESFLQGNNGSSQVYLVEYLVQISDPQRLVQKKLKSIGYKEIEIKNFNGVGFVYHYSKE